MKKTLIFLLILLTCVMFTFACQKQKTINDGGIIRVMSKGEKEAASIAEAATVHIVETYVPEEQTSATQIPSESESPRETENEIVSETATETKTQSEPETVTETKTQSESETVAETRPDIAQEQTVAAETVGTAAQVSHITDTVACKAGNIVIDADVYGINKQFVKTYDFAYDIYSEKQAMSMLAEFVGEDTAGTFKQNFEWWIGGENGNMSLKFNKGFKLVYGYICSPDNKYTESKGDKFAPGCSMSVDECQAVANKIVSEYITNEYKFVERKICPQENVQGEYSRTGHYEFIYNIYADGINIFNINEMDEFTVTVAMIDNTVISVNISNLSLIPTGTYNYMTVQDAIECIRKNIWMYDEFFIPGNINKVKFEYVIPPDMGNGQTMKLDPSWVFYGDEKRNYYISVNAVTGEITVF